MRKSVNYYTVGTLISTGGIKSLNIKIPTKNQHSSTDQTISNRYNPGDKFNLF